MLLQRALVYLIPSSYGGSQLPVTPEAESNTLLVSGSTEYMWYIDIHAGRTPLHTK